MPDVWVFPMVPVLRGSRSQEKNDSLNFMAVSGTPLRQKLLIRGVVGDVLQDPHDVNLAGSAKSWHRSFRGLTGGS